MGCSMGADTIVARADTTMVRTVRTLAMFFLTDRILVSLTYCWETLDTRRAASSLRWAVSSSTNLASSYFLI